MAPFFTFTPSQTSVNFAWPPEVSGLERIALSAHGDLQRILSAFFARPINIATVYSHTYTEEAEGKRSLSLPADDRIASTSASTPIYQARQVELRCSDKVVCTATSTIILRSPKAARLFLEDKFAVGQMFSKLGKPADAELLEVGFDTSKDGTQNLWRKYLLHVDELACEILEVFPSREMFTKGVCWLLDEQAPAASSPEESKAAVAQTHQFTLTLKPRDVLRCFLIYSLPLLVYIIAARHGFLSFV
ncbi:hypothetical protein K525DRAFT_273706 [Schizophyllum commune Loenen D]|nr:hypothetical protein K525DRAFT_273706 [Schizophyllum commune Loenen D]